MNASNDLRFSFELYYRARRITTYLAALTVVLGIVCAAISISNGGTEGVAQRVEGLALLATAISFLALAASLFRLAIFKCPRCGKNFSALFAGGDSLYGFAKTCQHCGLERPPEN